MQSSAKIPILSGFSRRLPAIVRGLPGAEAGLHPNEVAGALVWFIPSYWALAAYAWHDWRRKTGGIGGATVLSFAGLGATGVLILTQSRSGLLGWGLAMLLLLSLAGRVGRIGVIVVVVAGVIALAMIGPGRVGEALMGGRDMTTDVTGTLNLSGRLEVWSRALYAIQDFPFTGMGLNAFRRIVPVLYPLFLVGPDHDIAHAHNHLLQAAVDLGLPGLIAYMAIWLVAAIMLIGVWQRSREGIWRALTAGLGAGLWAHFIYGLTDTVALGAKPGIAWWALLGLAVTMFSLHERMVTPDSAQVKSE